MSKLSRVELGQMYENFRTVDVKSWNNADPKAISHMITGKEDKNTGLSFRILVKLAHACNTVEEFIECIESNDMPSLKLDNQEMQLLQGGFQIIGTIGQWSGYKIAQGWNSAWASVGSATGLDKGSTLNKGRVPGSFYRDTQRSDDPDSFATDRAQAEAYGKKAANLWRKK